MHCQGGERYGARSSSFGSQDAGILGQVTDESGAILPGVTVTAASPSLQLQQVTAVTNERGEYRLTPLPIGTYSVEYTLAGFQTVRREDVRLTAGFAAKVDVVLKVGGIGIGHRLRRLPGGRRDVDRDGHAVDDVRRSS